MYLRKIFQEFLVLHTQAEPAFADGAMPILPWSWPATDVPAPRTWAFDWRWLETVEDTP